MTAQTGLAAPRRPGNFLVGNQWRVGQVMPPMSVECDSSSTIGIRDSPTHRDRPANGSDGMVRVATVREDANR